MQRTKTFYQAFLVFALFLSSPLIGEYCQKGEYHFSVPELLGFETYYGGVAGEYAGDLIACLSDGTKYKVHPDHQTIVANWDVGVHVNVLPRFSFYWFKREHQLTLYNIDREEKVHVMLLSHGDQPRKIMTTVGPYATETTYIEEWGEDADGNEIFLGYSEKKSGYVKEVHLSDGSVWIVSKESDFKRFVPGRQVTPTWIDTPTFQAYLITGLGSHSGWAPVELVYAP